MRTGAGIRDTEVNVREYVTHNSRVQPVVRESEELSLTDLSGQPHCVIGNDVSGAVKNYAHLYTSYMLWILFAHTPYQYVCFMGLNMSHNFSYLAFM